MNMLPLGAVVERRPGTRNPTSTPSEAFVYVDVAAVDNERKAIVGARAVLGAEAPSRARKVIRSGDVLVSTVRPNLNAVALVPDELDNQIASTGFAVLRATSAALSAYLFYFVRSRRFIDGIMKLVAGAMYPAVSESQVLAQTLPVPPLPEQRRIVDILSRADGIVRLRREAAEKTTELIPALFASMFGDPATNPKHWSVTTVAGSGAHIRYGIGQPLPEMVDGTPFLRATNVKRGSISREGLVLVDAGANPIERNPPLRATDILVVRSGAYTGDVAQVGNEFEGAIAGYDLVLSPSGEQRAEVLATYLLTDYVQRGYINKFKTRAAQPHLNATQLGEIPLPHFPLELQDAFVSHKRQIDSIREQQHAALVKAEKVFDALLASTFGARVGF